jgi:hypothetical protein
MELLFAVLAMAGLFLAINASWFPPSWLGWVADRVTGLKLADDGERPRGAEDGPGEADETTVEWGLLARPFIRRRLDALAEELERLDRDPDVFAKAFHTMVARSAHDALLADASRLAHQPPRYASQTFDVELMGPSTGFSEELEL